MEGEWEQFQRESVQLRPDTAKWRHSLDAFVRQHVAENRRVVCVTSGGTSVPLEKKTVRYIDNFSTGNRGAASAEAFLRQGYAVVFLHRKDSLFPFKRHLDKCEPSELVGKLTSLPPDELASFIARTLGSQGAPANLGNLLSVPFTSVFEYLFLLREACAALSLAGRHGMVFLAAAVADFFVPESQLATDKIQSTPEGLALRLSAVPKVLRFVKQAPDASLVAAPAAPASAAPWAPHAFVVSFKLETNPNILIAKAAGALQKHGVDMVVSNVLGTHTRQVTMVSRAPAEEIVCEASSVRGDEQSEVCVRGVVTEVVRRGEGADEIEHALVDYVVRKHAAHIQS